MFQKKIPVFGLDISSRYIKFFQSDKGFGLKNRNLCFSSEHFENLDHRLELTGNVIEKNRKSFPEKFKIIPALTFDDVKIRTIRIPKTNHDNEIQDMIQWELSETLDFSLKTHQLRYLFIGEMKERQGTRDEYLVVVVPNTTIETFIHFYEHFKILPGGLDFEGFSLSRFLKQYLTHQNASEDIVALLDIGYNSSSIIITRHRNIAFVKNFSFGFKDIDQAFSALINRSVDQTVKWRENLQDNCTEENKAFIQQALPTIIDPFEKMINSCLRYYSGIFRGEYVQKLFITGSYAEFPGLADSISTLIGVKTFLPYIEGKQFPVSFWAKSIGQSLKEPIKS